MKPFSEVVKALGSEGVVIPLPGELGFEVAAGGQGLAGFDDLEKIVSTFGPDKVDASGLKSLHRDSWYQARGALGGCSLSVPRAHPHGRDTRGSSCGRLLG